MRYPHRRFFYFIGNYGVNSNKVKNNNAQLAEMKFIAKLPACAQTCVSGTHVCYCMRGNYDVQSDDC